jgi:hypothetical protein
VSRGHNKNDSSPNNKYGQWCQEQRCQGELEDIINSMLRHGLEACRRQQHHVCATGNSRESGGNMPDAQLPHNEQHVTERVTKQDHEAVKQRKGFVANCIVLNMQRLAKGCVS